MSHKRFLAEDARGGGQGRICCKWDPILAASALHEATDAPTATGTFGYGPEVGRVQEGYVGITLATPPISRRTGYPTILHPSDIRSECPGSGQMHLVPEKPIGGAFHSQHISERSAARARGLDFEIKGTPTGISGSHYLAMLAVRNRL